MFLKIIYHLKIIQFLFDSVQVDKRHHGAYPDSWYTLNTSRYSKHPKVGLLEVLVDRGGGGSDVVGWVCLRQFVLVSRP